MTFKVKINNIGKLTDAEIRIGRFTVFAGPNNTGKSFVSKLLYSFFDAMNANHAERINELLRPLKRGLKQLKGGKLDETEELLLSALDDEIKKLESHVKRIRNIEELYMADLSLRDKIRRIGDRINDILSSSLTSGEIPGRERFPYIVSSLKDSYLELPGLFHTQLSGFIGKAIGDKIQQNLIHNFQVPRLADLSDIENISSEIDVEWFGKFQFSNEGIYFINPDIPVFLDQQYSRVIYLESPVYWRLKNALEDARDRPGYSREGKRERLTGIPGYFYDLAVALKYEYTGDVAFPDVYKKLTGREVIGGKIAITESGNLSFQENGRSFPLPVTAMGIANLGILALLIERKVLDIGSFIFIDEPEAHLHPAWQVVMAETLFELSRQGANVVVATHSVDILKWLEVHVKKNPDDKQLIALNRFPANSSEVDEDFETKMANIKQELTQPFSDLYVEGLL